MAPCSFEIKHIPGRLNVVADALNRDTFVNPLRQRLLCEPYSELLDQVCDVSDGSVQDAFHLTCQPQSLGGPSHSAAIEGLMSEEDVSSLLSSLDEWDSAPSQHWPP